MFIANAVLPIEGRAAMITRSDFCKPAGHFVEIVVVRRQSGDALPALQQRIHRSEGILDDLLHAHEAAPNALFGELEDGRLRHRSEHLRPNPTGRWPAQSRCWRREISPRSSALSRTILT